MGEDTLKTPPPPTKSNSAGYSMSDVAKYKNNLAEMLELVMNRFVSKTVPMKMSSLDSIAGDILRSKGIRSSYQIYLIDSPSKKVINKSRANAPFSIFEISSENLNIDLNEQFSLQLILINPFGLIFKRMGIMLVTTLIFIIICLLAFRYLQNILAKQKQLVIFKNEFLGTIAHELKRPVASLSFNLDCLLLPAFVEDQVKHNLLVTRSISATTELNNTINMIVSLAKVEEGLLKLNKEPVDLSKLFIDLKNRFMNYPVKNIEIKTDFESQATTVSADEQLLTQCFANLIDNSIKYSGKEVVIVIQVQRSDKWIVISIQDNGFGIPKEKLPVIFDKYTRLEPDNTKINGFGIGLNYVKTIVEKHEGEVNVHSYPGEGTKFSILLPNA